MFRLALERFRQELFFAEKNCHLIMLFERVFSFFMFNTFWHTTCVIVLDEIIN